ncbi:formylglycine-generating enzyme family protein, partial [Zoogloea sp.]|uniref:formylglycine-generating enzyme family protein n=1 Tax=Zoogloea sp. TaxID=49181 RepID=UPI0035ADF099
RIPAHGADKGSAAPPPPQAAHAGIFTPAEPIPAATPTPLPARILVSNDFPTPGTVFRNGPDFPELVVVPPGRFLMGSPNDEDGRYTDEGPRHEVTIAHPFAVGRYPVTFAEWDSFVAAGSTRHKPDDEGWGRGRQPVIHVSWDDAQDYVAWLRDRTGQPYRLLSEAEWEYAARAGSQTCYPWGDAPGKNKANFDGSGSQWSKRQTSPVGSFAANAFGLHDMIGNVWEWVQDTWHDSYQGAPDDGRAWEEGSSPRVVRGGSWLYSSKLCRAASRLRYVPDNRDDYLGFRVCCAPPIV